MLVVISIVAFLFGIGVTAIRGLSFHGFEAEAVQAKTLLRSARNFARFQQSRSIVEIDPVANTIGAKGLDTMVQWHFEDVYAGEKDGEMEAPGSKNIRATVRGAELARGYVQQGILFGTNPNLEGTGSYASVSARKITPSPEGLEVSIWCRPGDFWSVNFQETYNVTHQPDYDDLGEDEYDERETRRLSALEHYRRWLREKRFDILSKGDSFYVAMNGAYGVIVGFHWSYYLKTPDGVLKPNTWNHIKVDYDCETLTVTVNGVPYGTRELYRMYMLTFVDADTGAEKPVDEVPPYVREEAFPEKIYPNNAPLYISGPAESFYGAIDEVHLKRYITPEVHQFQQARLMGKRRKIYFTPQGKLDAAYHDEPALVMLTDDDFYEPPEKLNPDRKDEISTTLRGPIEADEALKLEEEELIAQGKGDVERKKITVHLNGTVR